MQQYLISVIVPCYNQGNYLEETLLSVLNQTYSHWECIIVDDGSTDSTSVVASKYTASDGRIKYIYQNNSGLSSARNAGIRISLGSIIFPLDSDDKIHPNYFEIAISVFDSDPQIGIVYCKAEYFGDKTGPWELLDFSLDNILFQSVIYASSFFKRSDFDKTGGYDSRFNYGWEDWDFYLSLIGFNVKVHRLDNTYFYYRYNAHSMSRKMTDEQRSHLYKLIYIKHHALYDALFANPFKLFWDNQYYKNSMEFKIGNLLMAPIKKIRKIFQKLG